MPREESFPIYKIYILRQNNFNYIDVAGTGRNSVLHYNFAHEFVPVKRSGDSSAPNVLWRWKQVHVVSSRGTAYLSDNSSSKPQNPESTRYSQVRTWEEVWTPNVVLFSELRESRVTYGSEDSGDQSLRDACLGKPISTNKRSFISSNIDSRWKGDNGKGGHKEGTQKQKVRRTHFCCINGHPPHPKVRVHPGDYSQ